MNMLRRPAVLADILLLAMDVDGVLTDGTVIIHHDGTESKRFSLLDGHGIKLWRSAGLEMAWISGRASDATRRRAEQLGVALVFENAAAKLPVLEQLLKTTRLDAAQVAYIGDDLIDLPILRSVGLAVAVPDAVDEVRAAADYVTTRRGGSGAVRETIEHILKGSGRWNALMERHIP
ncbi:MAG TPA: HAD-IIIA family hydrolase [Sedimentisphaerales bacterium]|nr:HAD-IIIA family hydrolase [Sedimentisphaerales bacterium]